MTRSSTVLHFQEGKIKKRSLMEKRTSRPQLYLHTGSSAWTLAIYPNPTSISVIPSGQHVGVADYTGHGVVQMMPVRNVERD